MIFFPRGGYAGTPTLGLPRRALSLLIPRAKSGLARAIYLFSFSTRICGEIFSVCRCSLGGAASTNAPPVEISDWLIFSRRSSAQKGPQNWGLRCPHRSLDLWDGRPRAARAQTLPHIDPQLRKYTRSESRLNCVDFTEISLIIFSCSIRKS